MMGWQQVSVIGSEKALLFFSHNILYAFLLVENDDMT